MAPPSTGHQRLVHFFDREIGNYIQGKQGGCEVFPAPFVVFLNGNDKTYVEPDISVIQERGDEIMFRIYSKIIRVVEIIRNFPLFSEYPSSTILFSGIVQSVSRYIYIG